MPREPGRRSTIAIGYRWAEGINPPFFLGAVWGLRCAFSGKRDTTENRFRYLLIALPVLGFLRGQGALYADHPSSWPEPDSLETTVTLAH